MASWLTVSTPDTGSETINDILCVAPGKFVVVGTNGTALYSHDGGATWHAGMGIDANNWSGLASDGVTVVAVAQSGTHRVATSTDFGATWSMQDASEANGWRAVCSPAVGTFVACAADGTHRVMKSTDSGATWTNKTAAAVESWDGIASNADGSLLMAFSVASSAVMTSSDAGDSWASGGVPSTFACAAGQGFGSNIVVYSAVLDKFAVSGYNTSTLVATLATSSTGASWSTSVIDADYGLGCSGFVAADSYGGFIGSLPFDDAISPTPTIIGNSADGGVTWTDEDTGESGLWGPAAWDDAGAVVVFWDTNKTNTMLVGAFSPPVTLSPPTLDAFARLVDVAQAIEASGGDGDPYLFAVVAGALPDGLALEADGRLTGFPRVAGTFTVTIRATDGGGHFGELEYTITVTGLRIVIAGVDRTVEVSAADLDLGLNRRSTAHFVFVDGYIPDRGDDVLVYAKDAVTLFYGGIILTRHMRGAAAGSEADQAEADCVDYAVYLDDAEVSLAYDVTVDVEDVIAAIVAQSLGDYGITYTPVATGLTLDPFTWTAITATEAFKRISDATGLVIRVLPLKELVAFTPLTDAAPADITDANLDVFDVSWADGAELASNVVDLLCGPTGNGVATQRWTVAALETSWEVDIQAVLGSAEAAHRANALLGASANYSDGETVTLGSSTYTFRASLVGDVAGEVLIGATAADSLANLIAAINGAGGGNYAPSTPTNTDASAFLRLPDQLSADALVAGAAGNAIPVSASAANSFWYGQGGIPLSAMQLGSDATDANGWTQGYVLENGAVAQPVGAPGSGAYYEWDATAGRGTISVGGGSAAPVGTVLELKYLAVFPFHARYPTPTPSSPRTYREAHPEIASYADGVALAQSIYARVSADRRDLEVQTDVDGFLPGQRLTVDITPRGGIDADFLLASVRVVILSDVDWEYTLAAQEAAVYQGSYVEQWKALTSGGGSSSTAASLTPLTPDSSTVSRRDSLGGNPMRFVADVAYVDLPGGAEFELDGETGGKRFVVEANGWVEATAAATASFQVQYWNGSAWVDITGATVAIAMTTRNTRYWGKGSAFTAPAGVNRVKAQIKGNVGAAAMVSGAAWIVSVAA